MSNRYGMDPVSMGIFDLDFEEYMTYQYLPIFISGISYEGFLPANLKFALPMIEAATLEEVRRGNWWQYGYVTAKRGFATPGNPLNRPGWHADGFGTPDVNYVWTDKYPTLFAIGDFGDISDDHILSVKQFTEKIDSNDETITLATYRDKELLRLDDTVIHAAPEIPAPGGERSFFKVSFSNERYNLKGNAHNYGLDYDWAMFDREQVRNDPARAGKDAA
jgi:hypothetical protein